jgi:hypothetical protein
VAKLHAEKGPSISTTSGPPGDGRAPLAASPGVSLHQLHRQYFDFTWRSLRHLGVPEHAVEDAVQDVWLTAHRQLGSFEGRSTPRTWLFGIVLNTVRNHRRNQRRHPPTSELPDDPDVGYPADPSYEFNGHFDSYDIPPFEGFAYELAVGADPGDVRRANPPPGADQLPADDDDSNDDAPTPPVAFDGKVELAFTLDAPFIPWCELQTDDLCNRVNGIGTSSDDPEQCYASVGFGSVPMDCHKAEICAGEHCRFEHRTTLGLRFSNGGLTGAFNDLPLFNERGFRTRPGTVRFRRVTPPAAVNP